MPFPRKLLSPGEEVVVEALPNWSVLARPISLALAAVAGSVALLVAWTSAPRWVAYALGVVCVLALGWLATRVAVWRSRLLVITTRRVIYRWGFLRRTGREIPLDRVQDVTYHQTLFERLVGAGSLTIESAGASGQEPFPDVRHPAEMQSLVNQLISGDWRAPARSSLVPPQPAVPPPPPPEPVTPPYGAPTVTASAAPAPAPPSAVAVPGSGGMPGGALGDQLRELERLHELGVITDAEFDRKRRELLGLS
ncbi:MAG TPA: PH domain-containing protein [Acidimicrobiales bacterium]|nr:PH domain-containing protein [Acidimicrobiales bacterium]